MPTPAGIIDIVASLQNDTAQQKYTDEACLPYLNMALRKLREIYQENDIPIINETSTILIVPAGTTRIAFTGTTPTLPSNLIEIQQLWESDTGQNKWVPMFKRDFIPHNIEGIQLSRFGIFAWQSNEIKLPSALVPIDLKLDYIKSVFAIPYLIEDIDNEMGVEFLNIESYLGFATAALCSMFIGENETRASALDNEAEEALERAMNIPTKGRQAIVTRRRPFRQAYKSRNK